MLNKRRLRRHSRKEEAELSVTPFMNLMVILVPFLLIMLVFAKITVLELQLPAASDKPLPEKDLVLEVIIKDDRLIVQNKNRGQFATIAKTEEGYDVQKLSETLQAVKYKYPENVAASILLEPDIGYESLVSVMDAVRAIDLEDEQGKFSRAELFPEISLGDAPVS